MHDQILGLLGRYMPAAMRPSGGSNVLTKCPFHKGGQETKPSFSINLEKGVWQCFTCHESGTLPRLLKLLEVPKATIASEMLVIKPHLDARREIYEATKANSFRDKTPFETQTVLPEEILGVYDLPPQKLIDDGFDPKLLRSLDIGYDRNNERIMYPLRDIKGDLAGFSGGATKTGQWPKYKVYQGGRIDLEGRRIKGDFGDWFDARFPGYTCENHRMLWHYDAVQPRTLKMSDGADTIYLVEGFKACLWMIQNGYQNTVALMGSYISDTQQSLLHPFGGTIILCLDNDDAGRAATLEVGGRLWGPMHGKVRVMQYPPGDPDGQPDDYEGYLLQEMVGTSASFMQHYNATRRKECP